MNHTKSFFRAFRPIYRKNETCQKFLKFLTSNCHFKRMDNDRDQTQPLADETIVAYLLGELPADESDRLEEAVFHRNELAEQVFVVEEELVDDYVWDRLTADRRARFERHYLITERRIERVRFAAGLRRQMLPPQPAPHPMAWWRRLLKSGLPFTEPATRTRPIFQFARPALALLLLAALTAGLWRIVVSRRTSSSDDMARTASPTPAARSSPASSVTPASSPTATPSPTAGGAGTDSKLATAFIRLLPDVIPRAGGQGPQTLTLSAETHTVELALVVVSRDYQRYRGVLETIKGRRDWSGVSNQVKRGSSSSSEIIFRVPAGRFQSDDYLLRLSGVTGQDQQREEPVDDYPFTVVIK